MSDLAVVTCYFSPAGFSTLLNHYRTFRRQIETEGVPLITVECAFHDKPHLIDDADIKVRSRSILFQKERLLNLGAEVALRRGFKNVAFFDCDIIYDQPGWSQKILGGLRQHKLVQCFDHADMVFSDMVDSGQGAMKSFLDSGGSKFFDSHSGLAWAWRRELLEQVMWYEKCILGSGDWSFAGACMLPFMNGRRWLHEWTSVLDQHFSVISPAGQADFLLWVDGFVRALGRDVGYIEIPLRSLPHGPVRNRQYAERHMLAAGFNPYTDIRIEPGLPIEWTGTSPDMERAVADYFHQRREDDLPISPPTG